MIDLLYRTLETDVDEKIELAHKIVKNEYDTKLYPAAIFLFVQLAE